MTASFSAEIPGLAADGSTPPCRWSADSQDRKCAGFRSRHRTGRYGRAGRCPWGTDRSTRHARRTRHVRRPCPRSDSRPLPDAGASARHPASAQHPAPGSNRAESAWAPACVGGGDRHYQHAMAQFRQLVERGDTLGNDVLVRREQVVGQRFPIRKMQNRQIRSEEGEFFLQALGALAVGGEEEREAFGVAGCFGNRQAQRGSWKIAPMLLAAGGRQRRKTDTSGRGSDGKNRPPGL